MTVSIAHHIAAGIEEKTVGCDLAFNHVHQCAADRQRQEEHEDERGDGARLFAQDRPKQAEDMRMPGEFDHPQQAQQAQHPQIDGAEEPEKRRQHRDEIDECEKAAHIFQPTPEGVAEFAVAVIDRRPDAQNIFEREDRGRDLFDRRERCRITRVERGDGFEHHGDDINDDEDRQRDVEGVDGERARRIIVKQAT